MQNKKTPLLYALVCLSVTVPLLSGCRFTGGPVYKTSSYQFFNPFASKSKDYDDSALVGKFDDPYGHGLPKQDVATPAGGYLTDPAKETRVAANSRGRTSSDSINDLRIAELARNSNAASSTAGIASTKPKPDSMLPPTGNLTASNPTPQLGSYGTTTPIDSGFGAGSGQLPTQQPQFATTSYPVNSNMPSNGQPGNDPFGQQLVAGQTNPQNQMMPNQPYHPGQQGNMIASTTGQSQYPYLNTTPNDPMYGVNNNTAMPGTPVSPQMVASTQGSVYGGGQPFGNNDATFNNQFQGGYPAQPAAPQGAGAMPQNAVMPNSTIPGHPNANFGQQPVPQQQIPMSNGIGTNDAGFGMNGFGNPANSGMSNPSATGAVTYPAFDPLQATMQPSPQVNQTQTYPGFNTPQQPANGSYQNGFNVFGSPPDSNDYRPGSTYGGW